MQCIGNLILAIAVLAAYRLRYRREIAAFWYTPQMQRMDWQRRAFAHRAMSHVDGSICKLNQRLWMLAWRLENTDASAPLRSALS